MNRNHILPMLLFVLFLMSPSFVLAEFYKYLDENGKEAWTDDLAKVPKDQRANVKGYKEFEDSLTPAEKQQKRQRENAARNSEKVKHPSSKQKLSPRKRAELEKIRAVLLEEKKQLVNEQQALKKFNYKLADAFEIKAHKKKIAELNKRIMAYEEKRQAFELEVSRNQ